MVKISIDPDDAEIGGLSITQWKKVGKGFLIAISGVVLTTIADLIPLLDFKEYTLIVAAVLSAGVNAGLKIYNKHKYNHY